MNAHDLVENMKPRLRLEGNKEVFIRPASSVVETVDYPPHFIPVDSCFGGLAIYK